MRFWNYLSDTERRNMKYSKEEWEGLATCIKTEQIPPRDIFEIFLNNPEFAEWYKTRK